LTRPITSYAEDKTAAFASTGDGEKEI